MKRYIRAAMPNSLDSSLAEQPWSQAEQNRALRISRKIQDWLWSDTREGYYDYGFVNEIAQYSVDSGDIIVSKQCIVYSDDLDENGRQVRKGTAPKNTIYFYTVSDDATGEAIGEDEGIYGYETAKDAIHAAMIYIKDAYGM